MAVDATSAPVLKEAQEVLDRGGSKHMDWGQMSLYWPPGHREYWGRVYPDLNSLDAHTKEKAFDKFLMSDESKPYRVCKPKYFAGA